MRKLGLVVPRQKQNKGIMHGIGGHTTHFTDGIRNEIDEERDGTRWITRMQKFDEEMKKYEEELEAKMNSSDVAKDEEFKKKLKDVRGRITRLGSPLDVYEGRPNLAEWQIRKMEGIREGLDEKREEEANILEERRQHALQSDTGVGNRLRAGMM